MTNYEYTFVETIKSGKSISQEKLDVGAPNLLMDFYIKLKQDFIPEFVARLYEEHGVQTTDWNVIRCDTQYVPTGYLDHVELLIIFEFTITTIQPIHTIETRLGQPSLFVITKTVLKIIYAIITAITAIIIALYYAPYIESFLTSVFTKETITKIHYGNPEDPKYCITETTIVTEPDPFVIGEVIILSTVALGALAIFVFGLPRLQLGRVTV